MEETRISRMYATLFMRAIRDRIRPPGRGGGPGLTILVLAVLLLAFWGLYSVRHYLLLSTLRSKMKEGPPQSALHTPMPGGQEAIALTRGGITLGEAPEFVSATLLPGRGMDLLQLTANLPGFGEVPLLVSPSLEDATAAMTGTGADDQGARSLQMGAAFLVPWAGRISGTPSPDGHTLTADWHGTSLQLPAAPGGRGGLLLMRPADSSDSSVMPDGGQAEAVFQAGDFSGHWTSQSEVRVTVLLSSHTLETTIAVHNIGATPEPIGIGWNPRFDLRPGSRSQMLLRLPKASRIELGGRSAGVPTGRLLPVENTPYNFTDHAGRPLGDVRLDDTFVHLMTALLDNGPVAELRDPTRNFGIRLTALSPQIKAFHVTAPPDGNFVSIEPQFNYEDPFGREWGKEDTGIVTLAPGQTVEWKVRMELFSLSPPAPNRSRGPVF